MKKKMFWLIPAIMLVFVLASCDNDGGSSGIGETLNLSGDVYTVGNNYNFVKYDGEDLTFTSNVGGTGSITDGKMNFTVGAPNAALLETIDALFEDFEDEEEGLGLVYSNLTFSPTSAKGTYLYFYINLSKIYMNDTGTSGSDEEVSYIYVDRDCSFSATGGTFDFLDLMGMEVTASNINLNFKAGWNTVNQKVNVTETSGSVSIKTGDSSSCKWTLGDY